MANRPVPFPDPCDYCAGCGYCEEEGRGESTCPNCLGTGLDQTPAHERYARHMTRGEQSVDDAHKAWAGLVNEIRKGRPE